MAKSKSEAPSQAKQSQFGNESSLPRLDQTSTRIRAFLSQVVPIPGCGFGEDEVFQEGRALIEGLAVAYDTQADLEWDLLQIAAVVKFLNCISPVKGGCYCRDDKLVKGVCVSIGHQAILEAVEDELREQAVRAKKRASRVAEVAHA
jgi:hypothetical protein